MKQILLILVFFSFLCGTANAGQQRSKQAHPDARRTREIQVRLVKAGYLQRVSGRWDATTEKALRQLQKDNGWQSKIVPDSRALIFLNLGGDYSRVLNPETAWLPGRKKSNDHQLVAQTTGGLPAVEQSTPLQERGTRLRSDLLQEQQR